MLGVVHIITEVLTLNLLLIYFVFLCVIYKKKENDVTQNKCQLAFCAVLCVLHFMKTICSILSSQPTFIISVNAFCVLIFGFCAVFKTQYITSKNNDDKDEKTEKGDSEEDE